LSKHQQRNGFKLFALSQASATKERLRTVTSFVMRC